MSGLMGDAFLLSLKIPDTIENVWRLFESGLIYNRMNLYDTQRDGGRHSHDSMGAQVSRMQWQDCDASATQLQETARRVAPQ
jgi:hypothetical protein